MEHLTFLVVLATQAYDAANVHRSSEVASTPARERKQMLHSRPFILRPSGGLSLVVSKCSFARFCFEW